MKLIVEGTTEEFGRIVEFLAPGDAYRDLLNRLGPMERLLMVACDRLDALEKKSPAPSTSP